MVDIASGKEPNSLSVSSQFTDKKYTLIDVATAYNAGRRFLVPATLEPYFTHAIFKAKQEEHEEHKNELYNDSEIEEYKRLKAKFSSIDDGLLENEDDDTL